MATSPAVLWVSTITIPLAAGNRQGNEDSDENHPGEVRARRVGSGSNKVIVWRWGDEKLRLPLVSIGPGIVARIGGEIPVPPYEVERLPATIQARDFSRFTSRLVAAGCSGSACRGSARSGSPGETSLNRWPSRGGR